MPKYSKEQIKQEVEERIESIRINLDVGAESGRIFTNIFSSKINHLRGNYLTRDEQIHLIRSNTKSSVFNWNVWYESMFVQDIESKHYNSDFVHQIMSLFLFQLEYTDFSHCNLQGIILKHADFKGCDFSHSNLSYSDLSFSHLPRVNFNHTNLQFTDLTCSSMEDTDLSCSDLRNNASFICITAKGSLKLSGTNFDSRLVFFDSLNVSYVLEKSNNKANNSSKIELIPYNLLK